MTEFELTAHMKNMLTERNILQEWLLLTIEDTDRSQIGEDGNIHYFRAIQERDGRILHVVVNEDAHPMRVITAFFDRRQRKMI